MKYTHSDAQAVEVVARLKRRGFHLGLVSNIMLPGKPLEARLAAWGPNGWTFRATTEVRRT